MSDTDYEFRGYRIPVDLMLMTGGGPDTFPQISDFHQILLKQWIDLKPSDDVLEIGCGIGRDAIPLSDYLTTGSYLGVDIIKPSVDWCTRHIAAKHRNFQFLHFDVKDQLHNHAGVIATTDIRLPLANNSVDKIFLFSVFTHMFKSDIIHYLKEFRRVLRPSGLVYATTFLYDEEILAAARKTNLTPFDLRFEHEVELGCRINDPAAPLGAVAYTRKAWDEMSAASRLKYAKPFLRGSWSGFYDQPQEGQDVAIMTRETAGMWSTMRQRFFPRS